MIYKSIKLQRQEDGRYEINYDGNTMMAADMDDAIEKMEKLACEDLKDDLPELAD